MTSGQENPESYPSTHESSIYEIYGRSLEERKDLKIWLTTWGKNEVGFLSHTLKTRNRKIFLIWGQRNVSLRETKKCNYKKQTFLTMLKLKTSDHQRYLELKI